MVKNSDLSGLKSTQVPPNALHPLGWSALHLAATSSSYLEQARILLQRGANPNIKEETPSLNPVDRAAWSEWVRGRHREFSPVIDPYAITTGFTPLHYAVLVGNHEMIKVLLEAGADPTQASAQGHLPRDLFDPRKQSQSILEELDRGERVYKERQASLERERRRKFPLEQQLQQHIVGQQGPIWSVAAAIRRKENGWHDEDKPLVFLFLGSSGIGKTALAKKLAEYVHKDDPSKGLIRIDMSEFQSKHEVSKFLGAPPGYVGYEEGGQLTEKLRECPNAVVLLDEVEKAHVDVLSVMLQVFDEGRLTDGKGNTVDCRDAIFIMTSNLAQLEIAESSDLIREEESLEQGTADPSASTSNNAIIDGKSPKQKFMDEVIYPILRQHFHRDEFLGRINETLLFLPFSQPELEQIVQMELGHWSKRALNKHQIKLQWTPEVVRELSRGYNIHYGARSIKHEVEKKVVNPLAKLYEHEQVTPGGSVRVELLKNGQIGIRVTEKGGSGSSGGGILSGLFK